MYSFNNNYYYLPFQFVICARAESGTLQDFAHLFSTKTEVVDCPHVRELHYFDL